MRRLLSFAILLLLLCLLCRPCICLSAEEYRSPYSIKLPWTTQELIPDLLEGERGLVSTEAMIPEFDWYGHSHPWVGPWGPRPREYQPPIKCVAFLSEVKHKLLIENAPYPLFCGEYCKLTVNAGRDS